MRNAIIPQNGTRGPAEHAVRDQILEAASSHFSRYGYNKTTVADLATAVGFSTAYIYRFFESKQAIAEAICRLYLADILNEVRTAVDSADTATNKFRVLFRAITTANVSRLRGEQPLYDIAKLSALEKWASSQMHDDDLMAIVRDIVIAGRQSGEFERKTPLDEICRAIQYAMFPFADPSALERNLDLLPEGRTAITGLVLQACPYEVSALWPTSSHRPATKGNAPVPRAGSRHRDHVR